MGEAESGPGPMGAFGTSDTTLLAGRGNIRNCRRDEESIVSRCSTHRMFHNLWIECKTCHWEEDYLEHNLHAIAIRLPYCCHTPHHVVHVWGDPYCIWAPGRGVRCTISTSRTHEGTVVNRNRSNSLYSPEPPKDDEEVVYFISQLTIADGRHQQSYFTSDLELNTLENWRAMSANFHTRPGSREVVSLDNVGQELPIHIHINE